MRACSWTDGIKRSAGARLKGGTVAELLPQAPLFLGDVRGNDNIDRDEEVSPLSRLSLGKAAAAHAQLASIVAACGNPQLDGAVECGQHHLRTEHSLPWRDIEFVMHVRLA